MEKRIVILGGGESGCGAAILAKKLGFDVFLSDYGTIADKYKRMLDEQEIPWEEGKHTKELILNAGEVIKSPGIPTTAPMVRKLTDRGINVISEIEFAGRYDYAKKVCITGSNGKTTTTSLIYHLLKEAGMTYDNVVKTTVLLADIADFKAVNEVYAEYFTGDKPARACYQAAALPLGVKVEIEAIAVK